mgnify:CR=1 FL=1
MKTIRDLDPDRLEGRRALVRVDYNVPLGEGGEVMDPARIRASYPTLRLLLKRGVRPVLVSHLGRPGGEPDENLSLRPVARFLEEDGGRPVDFGGPPEADAAVEASRKLDDGEILVVENTRFHPGEKQNDREYARRLARLGDLFVNDAFAACHRAHASTVGVAEFLDPAVAGLLVEKEILALDRVRDEPEAPLVLVVGGAKIADKLPLLRSFVNHVDAILAGGGVANTLLAAGGRSMADSLVEDGALEQAREIQEEAGGRLRLPGDLVVAPGPDAGDRRQVVDGDVPRGHAAFDIGPETRERFAAVIHEAATLFWNGPMGMFEEEAFREGTDRVAEAVARATERDAFTVVGGGDSARAVREAGYAGDVSHLSTGGGASLEYVSSGRLPALEALEDDEQ